jgi:hypothetical protein
MGKPQLVRKPASPAAVLLRGFLLVSWLWFAVPWLWTLGTVDGRDCYHMTPAGAGADLRGIRERLAAGQDERMHRLFPEGRLFSHSFYGFTLVNLAAANPGDAGFRREVLVELPGLITRTEELGAAAPFDQCRGLTPKGGIIAAGHANLLHAGYAVLGGKNEGILQAYHARSAELFEAFGKSATGSLESYPAQTWPVDNLAALESLRLHDVLYGTAYTSAAARWAEWMGSHKDGGTGLLNMQIDGRGWILDGPRGCGLSWTLAFLPNLAPELAREQYGVYRATWFGHPLGTTGIREFPRERTARFTDSDTGPIIFGYGTAATGFGIAAAKANNDTEDLTGLLRALEIFSFPAYSTDLSHSRFFGQVLLADELALWGQTLCRWDAPTRFPPPPAPAGLRNFWVVEAMLGVLTVLASWMLVRSVRRAWRSFRAAPRPMGRVHAVFLVLVILTLVAVLVMPAMRWIYGLVVAAVLEIVERRVFPVRSASGGAATETAPATGAK